MATEGNKIGGIDTGGFVLHYRNLGRADGAVSDGDWMRFIVDDLARYNKYHYINTLAIGDADLGNA